MSVLLVSAFVMVLASFQASAAFAYPRGDEADTDEGEPKHEINEPQNRLHHTDDSSMDEHLEEHLEDKIDAWQAPLDLPSWEEERVCQPAGEVQDCWPKSQFNEKRDECIALSVFSLGLVALLDPECKKVLR